MRHVLLSAALAVLALTGRAEARQKAGKATEGKQTAALLEQRMAKNASGWQVGEIARIDKNQLVLRPYEPHKGEAEIELAKNMSVFRGDARIARDPLAALKPGTDVRVYFDEQDHRRPRLLGVAVLSPQEASRLQRLLSFAPVAPGKPAASGIVAGKLAERDAGRLMLESYDEGGPGTVRFTKDMIVLRKGMNVGREALTPGSDVRVYYAPSRQGPRAVGVEILSQAEVQQAQAAG